MTRCPDMHRLSVMGGIFTRRVIFRSLLLPLALLTAGVGDLVAEDGKDDAKPKVVFPPEVEQKFTEFIKKAGDARRILWMERLKQEIAEIAKTTALGADESKALDTSATDAADACLQGWRDKLSDRWRQYLGEMLQNNPDGEAVAIDQVFAQVDQAAQSDWFGDYVRPYEHPKWVDGIRQTLGAEKSATWEKAEAARKDAFAKETADILKAAVETVSRQQQTALATQGAAIKAMLGLPKERGEKLDALAKTVSEANAASLRKRGERMLFAMDSVQRQQILANKRFYLQPDEKDAEAQQIAWKEGVARVLTDEEVKQFESTRQTSKERRVSVLGKILLILLDERVAFTDGQREKLQPIAERLLKDHKPLQNDSDNQGSFRFSAQMLLSAGAKATEEELGRILEPSQKQNWIEASGTTNYRTSTGVVGGLLIARKAQPAIAVKTSDTARDPEPEDVENAISDYLHAKTVQERKRLLSVNILKAEDAARIAGLTPEKLGRLTTAARGLTEAMLTTWKGNINQTVRSQLVDATPETVKQRLASIGGYSYSQNPQSDSAKQNILDKTLKAELSEPQRATWKKETDARATYRNNAIAAFVLSELDRRFSLSKEQWTKLEPIIAGNVKTYTPDIESMFSAAFGYSWFLQSYSVFIPVVAVPEAEMKAILNGEQWESFSANPEIENSRNYWENVQSRHQQRVKEVEKK